jgi:hypothetical protein
VRRHGQLTGETAAANIPDSGRRAFDRAAPNDRLSDSTTNFDSARNAQRSNVRSETQGSIRTNAVESVGHSKKAIGFDPKPDIHQSTNIETRPNFEGQPICGAGQRRLSGGVRASVASTLLQASRSAGAIPNRPTSEAIAWNSLPGHTIIPVNGARVGPGDAGNRAATRVVNVRASHENENSSSVSDIDFQDVSRIVTTPPRQDGASRLLLEPKEDGLDRQAIPREASGSIDQLPVMAGELWLDTLSLREWLQAYLSAEMGHALQAVDQPGSAFE